MRKRRASRGLSRTASGWRIRWSDSDHHRRQRNCHDEATARTALAQERKRTQLERNRIKFTRSFNLPQLWPPANLRCAQARSDGTRCRRIATTTDRHNGRLACATHSTT